MRGECSAFQCRGWGEAVKVGRIVGTDIARAYQLYGANIQRPQGRSCEVDHEQKVEHVCDARGERALFMICHLYVHDTEFEE